MVNSAEPGFKSAKNDLFVLTRLSSSNAILKGKKFGFSKHKQC